MKKPRFAADLMLKATLFYRCGERDVADRRRPPRNLRWFREI